MLDMDEPEIAEVECTSKRDVLVARLKREYPGKFFIVSKHGAVFLEVY